MSPISDRTARVLLTADASGLEAGMAKAAAATDAASDAMGDSVDGLTTRTGGLFNKLGNTLGNLGVPGSEAFGKIGDKIADTDTKGQKFMQTMSTLGGATLLAGAAGFAAVSYASIKLANDFNSTVTSIAANADIPVSAAQKIGQAFLSTAGTTIYSGQQIASAYASVAGQLGATQGKALDASQAMTVMKAAMDLAEGSGTSLSSATSALSAVMETYQIKADGASKASDDLFSAARLTGQGVDATSAAVDKIHTKLGDLTPPLNQVGGLLVDMTHSLGSGRAAMTALSSTMTALIKPASDVTTAQANLKAATDALPPSLQTLATQVTNGAVSSTAATKAAEGLGIAQGALFSKFVTATGAMATASEAASKMGISVLTATGQVRPLPQIISELHDQIEGLSPAMAVAKLTADGFGSSSAKLASIAEAGPAVLEKYTDAVSATGAAHAAAEKQSQTFNHQMELLKATTEDYAVDLGEFLIPKLVDLEHATADTIEWFEKHKIAAEALAVVIGGTLATAVGVFTVNTAVGMVNSLRSALTSVGVLSAAEDESAATTDALTAAITSLETRLAGLLTPTDAVTAAQDALNIAWTEADALADTLDAGTTALSASYVGLAGSTEAAAAATTTMDASVGAEGAAGALAGADGAATGFAGALGPLGLAVGGVAIAAIAADKAFTGTTTAMGQAAVTAGQMADSTIPEVTLKLGALTSAQQKLTAAFKDGSDRNFDDAVAYSKLGSQIDQVRTQQTNLNNNLNILSNSFGISKGQAQSLASELGVNLGAALSPAQVTAFRQQIQQSGLDMDTAGSKASNMSSTTVAALSQIGTALKTQVSSANWAALGTSIDTGIANGITASDGVVTNAASGMVQQVITASRQGLKAASPSQVFHELGTWVGQGFAQGIDATAGLAANSVQRMTSAAISAGQTSTNSGITPAYASSGAGGGSVVAGGGSSGSTTLALNIDGQTFARLILPALQTQGSLYQRTVPQFVFGAANASVSA